MKAKEVAIISILFDSDKRWCPESIIMTCPRNFACLSTTHKFILNKKILKYLCTMRSPGAICHVGQGGILKLSIFHMKILDERIIFALITMGEFLLVIEI